MKSNIIKSIIAGVVVAGAMATTGVIAYNQGWDKGYDAGWDRGVTLVEAAEEAFDSYKYTDAYLWETYHDCDMYGLPEYAREQCNK